MVYEGRTMSFGAVRMRDDGRWHPFYTVREEELEGIAHVNEDIATDTCKACIQWMIDNRGALNWGAHQMEHLRFALASVSD
jgi:tRNA(Ile)-lysidine synthase TilS/MesJ